MMIKLDTYGIMPTRAHPDDAGLDLFSPLDCWVYKGGLKIIDTGVHVMIPKGYVGLLTSKSGLMSQGITTRGTIDSGYTGSIKAVVYNDSQESYRIAKGQKITQLVIVPCLIPEIEVTEDLPFTDRGDGGFGSSGA